MSVKVVIADDHRIVREGIKAILGGESWLVFVGEASNGEEVLELLERQEADLVMLDIDMPFMDGISCTKLIRKFWPKVAVLIVSMYQDERHVIDAFRAGASGYISKDACKAEMISAIQALIKGSSYFSRAVSEKLFDHLNRPERDRPPKEFSELPALTARETEVLMLITKEYTNQEIADRLFISPHTVVSHRRNLLQKLNARNTAGLVRQASLWGLLRQE